MASGRSCWLTVLAITGCGFLRNAEKIATTPEPVVVASDAEEASEAEKAEQKAEAEEQKLISEIRISNIPEREETRQRVFIFPPMWQELRPWWTI